MSAQEIDLIELSPSLLKQIEEVSARRGTDPEALKRAVREGASEAARVFVSGRVDEQEIRRIAEGFVRRALELSGMEYASTARDQPYGQTVEERLATLRELAESHKEVPPLADHALKREHFYEEDA